jgi:hypothetical protein
VELGDKIRILFILHNFLEFQRKPDDQLIMFIDDSR